MIWGFGLACTIGLRLVIAIAKHNRCTDEWKFLADFAFEKTLVRPVEQPEIATVDDKPRWADIGLDDIFELGTSIFETGWRMLDDGLTQDFVEFGGFDFEVASGIDFGSEFKKFGNILPSFAACD